MDFNIDRFITFGRYDLIINKAFYRTMALITIFGATGLATIGFFIRWLIFKTDEADSYVTPFCKLDEVFLTAIFLLAFASIMHVIFAGCTFHNLRNKQGRITELTLPATNLEKFTWHIAVVVIGGSAAIIASVLCADIVNAILNLAFHPIDAQRSLTLYVGNILLGTFDSEFINNPGTEVMNGLGIKPSFMFACTAISISGFAFFILGNAIKYKYNIILTYIIYEFAVTAIVFGFMYLVSLFADNDTVHQMTDEEGIAIFKIIANLIAIFNCLLTALYIWLSYHLYKKAQITSGWNK